MAARGSLKNAEGALRKRAQTSITKTNTTLGVPDMGRAHVGLQPNTATGLVGTQVPQKLS